MTRVLFGVAEAIPGEEKWTYTMKAFKKSLLRKMLHEVGVIHRGMFGGRRIKYTPPEWEDDEDPDLQQVAANRLARCCEYYVADNTFSELGVFVITNTIGDRLFYSLLGGVDKDGPLAR